VVYADLKDGEITVKTEYRDKDLIRMVAGARYNAHDYVWRVPLSWSGYQCLRGVFRDRLEFGAGLATWAWEHWKNQIEPAMTMRSQIDAPGDPDLYPFQRAGVKFLDHVRWAILTDEMGTGKTIQAIRTMVAALRDSGDNPFPAIIVCPNSMKATWRREFNIWWPGVKVVLLEGGRQARLKQIDEIKNGQAHVLVANWEALRGHAKLAPYGSIRLKRCMVCDPTLRDEYEIASERVASLQRQLDVLEGDDTDEANAERERLLKLMADAETERKAAYRKNGPQSCERCPRELNDIPWTTVVADESHRAKEPKAKQTRALWGLRTDATVFRFALTGTPIADAPDDFWSQLHFIDPKAWPAKTKYVDRYCLTSFNPFGGMTVIGLQPEHKAEFFSITDPCVRRMPKSLVLSQLPPKVYTTRYVPMSPKQEKAYRAMRDEMVAQLDDRGSGSRLVATNPLTQLIRLSQFASSYAHLEEEIDSKTGEVKLVVRLDEPSNKIDALLEVAEELSGKPAGVFAQSRQLIELASGRFAKLKIPHVKIVGGQTADERMAAIDRFQRGEVPFVLATVGAGGIGITLTRGDTCIFLQRSWSRIENAQAEDRFHRIGSEIHESINIVDIVTPGTIEEGQRLALQAKGERAEEVLRDTELLRSVLRTA
jgi:SNF2 family DNA or RNA helicase